MTQQETHHDDFGENQSIRLKSKTPQQQQQRQRQKKKDRHGHYASCHSSKHYKKKRGREALGAIILYVLCISLPSLFGILVRWYECNFVVSEPNGHRDKEPSVFPVTAVATAGYYYYNQLWNGLGSACRFLLLEKHLGQYMKRHALSDVQFVFAISTFLSILRVFLVYMLVPRYLAPRRLAALFHAKSTHLLSSSEYHFSKNALGSGSGSGSRDSSSNSSGSSSSSRPIGLFLRNVWTKTGRSLQRSLGHESQYLDGNVHYNVNANVDAAYTTQLFMAPRYATAVFRLLFCLVSCSWALAKFSRSDFWPVWVGGRMDARTKYCWDLSGSVAIQGASLDSDFDHQNTALRYFFLGQASYQIHSLSFHFLSMMLLLVCSSGRNGDGGCRTFLSARTSLKSYVRPIMEHSFYFVLTVMTYMFSGLRRLGAICIFVLEFSSMVLQLLQICINAPEQSRLKDVKLIRCIVHRFMAVPIFIYCRFFVLPFIVQYSALFESAMWLKQIEHALTPGVAMVIYMFFNGMLLLAFGLNLVYLRRLLFHPSLEAMHLEQPQEQQQQQQQKRRRQHAQQRVVHTKED